MEGQTQASHSNQLEDGKGMGIKAPDNFVAAICATCHAEIDQGKTYTKDVRKAVWDKAHKRTIAELFRNGKLKVLLP
jgi:ferredoxin